MILPVYQQIADDILSRIADGRLLPGDLVPSTRQISRDWHVAPATAARALTLLRHQGVVRGSERSAAIVADTRRTRRRPNAIEFGENSLRSRIVAAAIKIADARGLDAVSMRSVSARMGVATMSIYRYVQSKEELVLLMADAAFSTPSHASAAGKWRERLEVAARDLWSAYQSHPWLASIDSMMRPSLLPNLIAHAEAALSALSDEPLDAVARLKLHTLFYAFIQGIAVNLEREAAALATTGVSGDEWMSQQSPALDALVATGRYPSFERAVRDAGDRFELRLDDLFEFGLGVMLDGVVALIESSRMHGAGRERRRERNIRGSR